MNSDILGLSRIKDFRVVVTLIGYRSQGESIIIRFVDENKAKNDSTLYCIVIDCYKLHRRNITKEFLSEYGVDHVDMLCWTHPHLDHSKGLEELLAEYCDINTEYLIPPHFLNIPNDIVTINNKLEKKIVDDIFEQNTRTNANVTCVSVKAQNYNRIKYLSLQSLDYSGIPVIIKALTPISGILDKYAHDGINNANINELSVSLLVQVGEYHLFFGADAIDLHLMQIDPDILSNCRFVKIPHHGSDTSLELLNLLPPTLDIAGTTVYHVKGDLPLEEEVIRLYKEKGAHVFCSSGYKKQLSPIYGVVEYSINIFEKEEIEYNIKCLNGAKEL